MPRFAWARLIPGAWQGTVVPQEKTDAVGHSAFLRALVGDGAPLLGKRDAGHIHLECLAEIDGETATAGADV